MLRIRGLALFLPVLVAFLSLLAVAQPAAANEKYAAIVVDGNTGETLYARNADARRYPASLTKMMTLYILFEELDAGASAFRHRLDVSANAAAQAPSKLGVRAGSTIKVEDAILALTTKSANDVAVVVAENIGGSVAGFAARMNRTARALGMSVHDLPQPARPARFRPAHDGARPRPAGDARCRTAFPTYYPYFGVRSFTYRGVRHRNHNRLLGSVEGVDGIKTGYTRASGFNLVTNVRRDGRHIIAVVMGGKTAASRDAADARADRRLPAGGAPRQPLAAAARGRHRRRPACSSPRRACRAPARPTKRPGCAGPRLCGRLADARRRLGRDGRARATRRRRVPPSSRATCPIDADDSAVEDPIAERITRRRARSPTSPTWRPTSGESDPIARLTEMAQAARRRHGDRRSRGRRSAAASDAAATGCRRAGTSRSAPCRPWKARRRCSKGAGRDGTGARLAASADAGGRPQRHDALSRPLRRLLRQGGGARRLRPSWNGKSFDCLAVPN